jgi:hypothetical protein
MSYQVPKLVQDVRRLRADVEMAVRGFDRFHKYGSGDCLRRQVLAVQRTGLRAWRDKAQQAQWLDRLIHEIDQLKEEMQFAQDVRAFRGLVQFQHLYRQVDEIGRQAGGWRKQHPSAQNARRSGGAQRGQILSTHATPSGVNA